MTNCSQAAVPSTLLWALSALPSDGARPSSVLAGPGQLQRSSLMAVPLGPRCGAASDLTEGGERPHTHIRTSPDARPKAVERKEVPICAAAQPHSLTSRRNQAPCGGRQKAGQTHC